MNAIEHASCTHVKMSAQRNADAVAIVISDNGKGIDSETLNVCSDPTPIRSTRIGYTAWSFTFVKLI